MFQAAEPNRLFSHTWRANKQIYHHGVLIKCSLITVPTVWGDVTTLFQYRFDGMSPRAEVMESFVLEHMEVSRPLPNTCIACKNIKISLVINQLASPFFTFDCEGDRIRTI
jgi:hypothetical protein